MMAACRQPDERPNWLVTVLIYLMLAIGMAAFAWFMLRLIGDGE